MLTRVTFRYRDGGNYRTSADYGAKACRGSTQG